MATIHFSVPTTEPEAFSQEWAEWNEALEESTPLEEPEVVERDLCDIVREHEEEEGEPSSSDADEWEKFWSRFDFPFAE